MDSYTVVGLPLPAHDKLFVEMRLSEKSKYDNTGSVSMRVTQRRVHIKIFVVEKQWVLHILCVCVCVCILLSSTRC